MESHITRRRRLFVLLAGLFGFLASTAVSAVPGAAVSDTLSTNAAAASESMALRGPPTERRSPSPSDLRLLARLVAAAHPWAGRPSQAAQGASAGGLGASPDGLGASAGGLGASAGVASHVAWTGVIGHSVEGHFQQLAQYRQYALSLRSAGIALARRAQPARPAHAILAASILRRGPPTSTGHPANSR